MIRPFVSQVSLSALDSFTSYNVSVQACHGEKLCSDFSQAVPVKTLIGGKCWDILSEKIDVLPCWYIVQLYLLFLCVQNLLNRENLLSKLQIQLSPSLGLSRRKYLLLILTTIPSSVIIHLTSMSEMVSIFNKKIYIIVHKGIKFHL